MRRRVIVVVNDRKEVFFGENLAVDCTVKGTKVSPIVVRDNEGVLAAFQTWDYYRIEDVDC